MRRADYIIVSRSIDVAVGILLDSEIYFYLIFVFFFKSCYLLYILREHNAPLILSSDSHSADTLDFGFEDAKMLLRDVGIKKIYTLRGGKFVSEEI